MAPFRNRLRTPEFSRRKRRVLYIKLALLSLMVASVLGGLSYISHRPTLRIAQVEVEGGEVIDEAALTALIKQKLSGKYLFLFPKDNAFIYSRRALEASVLEGFKRVETVKVSSQGLQTVVLAVSERSPRALYCGENRPAGEISMTCYFADSKGYIYAQAPEFTGDVYLRFYGPLRSGETVGQSFLPAVRFQAFLDFMERLNAQGVRVVEFALAAEGTDELFLEDGTRILFSDAEDLSRMLDNLLSVLSSENLRGRETLNLEYIDLRFGNKVYFKERE